MSDYKPVVGEFVKLKDCLDGYQVIYGQECIGEELRIMAIFMDGVVDVCVIKFNNVNYCFRADLLEQIRTQEELERDAAIAEMSKIFDAGSISENKRCATRAYDAGYHNGPKVGEKIDMDAFFDVAYSLIKQKGITLIDVKSKFARRYGIYRKD